MILNKILALFSSIFNYRSAWSLNSLDPNLQNLNFELNEYIVHREKQKSASQV
jgi:hypothetical protein